MFSKTSSKTRLPFILFRRIIRICFIGGIVGAGAFWAYSFFMGPSLRIWKIEIHGQETISDIALHHLSDIHFGSHVLAVNPQHAEKELLRHPWIRQAKVEIQYPSTVHIQVQEHKPTMLLALDKMWYLSESGIPFRQADSSNIDYPILTGIPNSWVNKHPHVVKKIIEDAMILFKAFEGSAIGSTDELSEILFEKNTGFTVILRNGTEIIFGFYEPEERLERLRQMVTNPDQALDLSQPKQIILDAERVAVVMPLSSFSD